MNDDLVSPNSIGMRICRKHNVPVIGLPLEANRCSRWMGEFNEASVNLDALKKLLAEV